MVKTYVAPIPDSPFDENVLGLIPVRIVPPEHKARHVSKYSTQARNEYHAGLRPMATMGPLKVPKEEPKNYLHRGKERIKCQPQQPDKTIRKDKLPSSNGELKPKSNVNFIKLNRNQIGHSSTKN